MKKIIFIAIIFISAGVYAKPCELLVSKINNAVVPAQILAKDLKFRYRTSFFNANPEIEMYIQNKFVISFASKPGSQSSIQTEYFQTQHSNDREAFQSELQILNSKLWWFERANLKIVLDFSKLESQITSKGVCATDVSSIAEIITEPQVIVQRPKIAPDRSYPIEPTTQSSKFQNTQPTR